MRGRAWAILAITLTACSAIGAQQLKRVHGPPVNLCYVGMEFESGVITVLYKEKGDCPRLPIDRFGIETVQRLGLTPWVSVPIPDRCDWFAILSQDPNPHGHPPEPGIVTGCTDLPSSGA